MIEITDEYRAVAKQFKKVFGYGIPLSMIPPTVNMVDLINNIKECVETRNDDLLQRFGVVLGEDEFF